jgi:penicillin-binding protein 1C
MREVSGVSGAGPIWHEIMAYLHRQSGSRQASAPADVTRLWVSFEDSLEPRREDVFIGDTTQSLVRLNRTPADLQHAAASILQPINGTILAVDPDIPAANQRTWFRASGVAAENRRQVFWRLDGKQIGEGGELAWMPWPGKHRVELVDAHGKVLDDVAIEVRGASPGQNLPSH